MDVEAVDRLVGALDRYAAGNALLVDALSRNAEAMFAVADSHAKLLAALLQPEDEPMAAASPQDERARMIAYSQVLGADGLPRG